MQSIRLAFRSLFKTPGFTAVAIITIALAIGANTAVFSLVNALLIRPLPFKAPQDLVLLFEKFSGQGLDQIPVSAPEYLDWEKQTRSYERIAAFNFADFNLTGGDMPERVQGAVVTPSLFAVLGVAPIKGRVFNENEFGEGNDNVVMISERLWRRRFNADSQVIGSEGSGNGNSYTVVGIMPAKFEFPLPLFGVQGGTFAERADMWKPIAFTKGELESRGSRGLGVIGRLKPGITIAQAQAEANTIVANWYKQFPDNYEPSTKVGAKSVPGSGEVNRDLGFSFVTFARAVATGILIGLIPALASGKPELTEALKEGGRGSTTGLRRNRLRNSLVIAEVALALVLLVGAGLLLKSFVRLQNVNPGFESRNVLTMEVSLPLMKYPRGKPVADFYAEATRRIKALPGVEAVAFTSILPLSGTNSDSSFAIEGRDAMVGKGFPDEEIRDVTPEYFSVLKVPLLQGRFFNDGDQFDGPDVTIVNNSFAKKWFPNQDAVGKRITFGDPRKPDVKWVTIVGVVGDMRHRGLDLEPQPEYYLPHNQRRYRGLILAVRSAQDPRSLTSVIRQEITRLDPDRTAANVRTLEHVAGASIAPRRLSVVVNGVFAAVALVLASVGIFGVMSFRVVQRTHEMGVRMALGAQRGDVLRLVIGRAAKLVLIGTGAGLVLGIMSSRALRAMLFNVGAFDPMTFVGVTFALIAVSLLASYIPALRATKADPMIALGHGA